MTTVRYEPAIGTTAGAIPVNTEVATHPRASDGANVQDVYIDGAMAANVHTGNTEVRTFSAGHVCAENSTNTPLAGNATFTGTGQDTLDYSEIIITVYSDKNSATEGLKVWWSADNITYDPDPDTYTITANVSKTFSFPCNRRYVKVTYINGATAQTFFLLSTLLKRFASKGSSHRIGDVLNQEDDAIVTKTLIAGKTTAQGGAIVDVKVNPSGTLTVDASGSSINTDLDALIEDRTQTPTKTQALNVQIGPGDLNKVPVVADVPHHHLHEGETHQYTYPPTALAQNGILNFRLVVGNLDPVTNKTPNFTLEIDTTGETWMTLYETPTTSANGTLAAAHNKNRNFTATVPNMTVYTAPTVTAVGTTLSAWMIGSGQKAGGVGRESLEWVLAANTVYLVRVVAQNAQNVCLRMIWYEDLGV